MPVQNVKMYLCSILQVSVSVYGSHEVSPTEAVHSTSSGEDTLNMSHRDNESPRTNTGLQDEPSPPPLPSPVEENEAVSQCVGNEGDGAVVEAQVHRHSEEKEEDHHSEEREGETRSRSSAALLTSDIPVEIENHLASSGNNSTIGGTTLEEKDNEISDLTLHTDQQEKTQLSSSNSEYHTPSLISDELKQTDETLVDTGNRVTVEDHTDGIVFQSHDFPAAPPVKFDNQLHVDEEDVLQPKPMAHSISDADTTRHTSTPGSESTPAITVTRETGLQEDVSLSSTASSFLDASQHIPKEYSSLSFDHHSDMEESAIHTVDKGRMADVRECDTNGAGLDWKVNALFQKDDSYLFPISNSPVDIVTMLTRLACFTSTLLNTLTPKLRHGAVPGLDEPRVSHPPL